MSMLVWDRMEDRLYETGVSHGVLFPKIDGKYSNGVVWNGLTAVTESPSGAEPTALWADDIKYLELMSVEEFGCTIEAYTYPDEFMTCDGSFDAAATTVGDVTTPGGVYIGQQTRTPFGFSYRTVLGNADEKNDHGYKLHLIYECMASPSEKAYATINDSPEAITFSWEVTTTPLETGSNTRPTASITIDSTKVVPAKLDSFLEILYGKAAVTEGTPSPGVPAKLPTPKEVIAHFAA